MATQHREKEDNITCTFEIEIGIHTFLSIHRQ